MTTHVRSLYEYLKPELAYLNVLHGIIQVFQLKNYQNHLTTISVVSRSFINKDYALNCTN